MSERSVHHRDPVLTDREWHEHEAARRARENLAKGWTTPVRVLEFQVPPSRRASTRRLMRKLGLVA